MNKEEFDINQELEQMRQDYAALKERFDKQQIINEKLLEKAFKSDARWLSLDKNSSVVVSILGVPAIITISIIKNLEWWFPVVACVFVLTLCFALLRLYKNLSKDDLYTEDILSATKKVKRFKQQYQRYFWGWMIAAVILAGAYAPSIYHSWSSPEQGIKMVIALFFLIVVLCILGYLYYKRLMNACDSILDRLKMKEEE